MGFRVEGLSDAPPAVRVSKGFQRFRVQGVISRITEGSRK